jgi:hypothetical protein
MNFIEAALTALRKADSPLDFRELWSLVVELGLDKQLASTGKTPWNTMGARVYIEVRDNPDAEIVALGERPKRFWLKSRALPGAKSAPAVSAPAVAPGKPAVQKSKPEWLEADLHPVLAHFARHTMGGVRVRTIPHQASAKAQFGEWVHPDIVGVRFPKAMLGESATLELARAIGASPIRIVSFELKREVKFGNLREAFFQTVSNSSWAHEAYLVAGKWFDDEEFRGELQRLSNAFGVGIIDLSVESPADARIVLPARVRTELDWATLDKLAEMNPVLREFLRSVRIDFESNKIHDGEYDGTPKDPEAVPTVVSK